LKIEFGTTEVADFSENVDAKPKKHGWLPVLVVLFLISYALMTMLIVEQSRTIESQRALIRELFRDSSEMRAARQRDQEERTQSSQSQAATNPSSQNPATQVPANITPSTQIPAKPAPSTQAVPQRRAQNEAARQKQFSMPSRPASDLVDANRALILI
jgi:flagellum-specific peptidoglycan hydrolase FlgJ